MGAFVDGARAVSRDRVLGQAASRRWERNNLTQGPTRHDLDAAGTGRGRYWTRQEGVQAAHTQPSPRASAPAAARRGRGIVGGRRAAARDRTHRFGLPLGCRLHLVLKR